MQSREILSWEAFSSVTPKAALCKVHIKELMGFIRRIQSTLIRHWWKPSSRLARKMVVLLFRPSTKTFRLLGLSVQSTQHKSKKALAWKSCGLHSPGHHKTHRIIDSQNSSGWKGPLRVINQTRILPSITTTLKDFLSVPWSRGSGQGTELGKGAAYLIRNQSPFDNGSQYYYLCAVFIPSASQ